MQHLGPMPGKRLLTLANGLDNGSTIYVIGMVNVPMLYEVAQDKKALGIVNCEVLWFFTLFDLFPCRTILGPFRTETDRLAMTERIEGFNSILQDLVNQLNGEPPIDPPQTSIKTPTIIITTRMMFLNSLMVNFLMMKFLMKAMYPTWIASILRPRAKSYYRK